ncbi:MAG: hypothetical protein OXT71_20340 [Acidobacteriota bacterium]|nr:hypothetical protein [Acidobacteriota bacterium]
MMLRSIGASFFSLILVAGAVAGETSLTWSRGPDLDLPRGGYSAVAYQEGILVAGGAYWREGEKLWTDRVDFYDPEAERWSQRPSLPEPLGYGGMVRIGEEIYLLGGGNGPQPQRQVFKLTEEGWSVAGQNPAPRYLASVVAVGSTIYQVAGSHSMTDLDRCTDEVWSLDVATGDWQRLAPIPGPPRMIHAAAVLGSSVYIFGGSTKELGQQLRNLDDAYRFDTGTGQWSLLGPAPVAARAWWAEPVGELIYLSGGYARTFLGTVYEYDPSGDTYTLVSSFEPGLADTEFLHLDGAFYGISGEDKGRSRFPGLLVGRFPEELSEEESAEESGEPSGE